MNIVELNNAIKSVRNWLKTNFVDGIGDLPNGFHVNPREVIFSGEIRSDFTIACNNVGVQYVNSEADCAVLGFYIDKAGIDTACLNQCIDYTRYYNGNHDQDNYTSISLLETGFSGDLVLVCGYYCDEQNNQIYYYNLYTTPNFTALREAADKEDEERWIETFGKRLNTRRSR